MGGVDSENAQRGGRTPFSLASYINTLFYEKYCKISKKRGGQGPFGPPLNPPLNALGSAETSDTTLEAVPSILYSLNRRHLIFLDKSSFFRLI